MMEKGSDNLRELIRILVRNLGVLEKGDSSCCNITISQCHAIVEIGRAKKISLIELSDLIGLEKSTMSRTINNLVESGLVFRNVDEENRRFVTIQLSEKGIEVFNTTEASMKKYYSSVFEAIPEEKRYQVLESLGLLTTAVRNNK